MTCDLCFVPAISSVGFPFKHSEKTVTICDVGGAFFICTSSKGESSERSGLCHDILNTQHNFLTLCALSSLTLPLKEESLICAYSDREGS